MGRVYHFEIKRARKSPRENTNAFFILLLMYTIFVGYSTTSRTDLFFFKVNTKIHFSRVFFLRTGHLFVFFTE